MSAITQKKKRDLSHREVEIGKYQEAGVLRKRAALLKKRLDMGQ